MTLRIMPEFDREGRAVCQFWLQGSKHSETPTDKKSPLWLWSLPGNLRATTPPPLLKESSQQCKRTMKGKQQLPSRLEETPLLLLPLAVLFSVKCQLVDRGP